MRKDEIRGSTAKAEHSLTRNVPANLRSGPSVELHIEELVLHGFAAGDRYSIAEALERELARLFRERSVLPASLEDVQPPDLNAGPIELTKNGGCEIIGDATARAVHEKIFDELRNNAGGTATILRAAWFKSDR